MLNLPGLLKVKINNRTIYSKDKNEYKNRNTFSYEKSTKFVLTLPIIMSLCGIDITKFNEHQISSLKNDLLKQLEFLHYKYKK